MDEDEIGENQQEIIDEEELQYMQQLKEVKKQYRENYESLKQVKTETNFIESTIDKLKSQLVSIFESWY